MDAVFRALIATIVNFIFISSLFVFFPLLCRRPPKPHPEFQTQPPPPPLDPPDHHQTRMPGRVFLLRPLLDHISMSKLAATAKSFSADAIVGDGGFGFVYRAELVTGFAVVVKKLSADELHGFREFSGRDGVLGPDPPPQPHQNAGLLHSGSDRVLIYEFLERGCLDLRIHDPDPLPWQTRIRIVHGEAKGLAFLHEECKPCIIHRDIKTSYVLLDADFGSRIADFGLAGCRVRDAAHVDPSDGDHWLNAPGVQGGADGGDGEGGCVELQSV